MSYDAIQSIKCIGDFPEDWVDYKDQLVEYLPDKRHKGLVELYLSTAKPSVSFVSQKEKRTDVATREIIIRFLKRAFTRYVFPASYNLHDPIYSYPFSSRTLNGLSGHDVITMGQLLKLTKKEILQIRNLGKKSLDEILWICGDLPEFLTSPLHLSKINPEQKRFTTQAHLQMFMEKWNSKNMMSLTKAVYDLVYKIDIEKWESLKQREEFDRDVAALFRKFASSIKYV